MRYVTTLALLTLIACNVAPIGFRDVPAQRITVGVSTFDVRIKHTMAHAIRINSEWAPNWKHTIGRFAIAFEQASGCQVVPKSLRGDQVVMTARLKCPKDRTP